MNNLNSVNSNQRGQPLPDLTVVQFFNPGDVQPKGDGVEVGEIPGEAAEDRVPGSFFKVNDFVWHSEYLRTSYLTKQVGIVGIVEG